MDTLCPRIWKAQAMSTQTVGSLYAAFNRRDGEAMAALYAPDGHFRDPVFGDLTGAEAGAMWRMLTRTARDLKVELAEHDAQSAHWIARYTFSTGRHVVNDIRASFHFSDGKIVDHVDAFDFRRWAAQALGLSGKLLGWTPILRGAVRRRARKRLDDFIAEDN